MSTVLHHLVSLVNDTPPPGAEASANLDQWSQFQISREELENDDPEELDASNDAEPSVLHSFSNASHPPSRDFLSRHPNLEPLADSLHSILSSSRSNDQINEELAELCGFENIELVLYMLDNRSSVLSELKTRGTNSSDPTSLNSLAPDLVRQRMAETLRKNAARPLFTHEAEAAREVLPHVYTSSSVAQGNVLSDLGKKYMLPLGTERRFEELYEEVMIPPARPVPPAATEREVRVKDLDPLARGCFPYETLNRIQSIVYPTAYGTNENMLVCAPTGAGKTDVAMLSILRVLAQHGNPHVQGASVASTIKRDSFKIIYVAPMKALAAEIVRKLSKRLKWLSIAVRELTGDMQLTKAEIAQTQIIVTTPEKWDVVTRKPTGEGELASSLKLLIIDEVHLLNEDRGAVIETIVARTLRQVESSQSVIRIVGLSATLPNYVDVAEFLSVSKYKGLFYFDSSFRPIPLEQHFIGVKGKAGSPTSRGNLDKVAFEKVSELVEQGHQVMVFVHARKETVKTAETLREMAMSEGRIDDYSCEEHPQWSFFRRDIGTSRNKEMKQLFDAGFGIHHAGMLRSDRNMMERMFEARAIKVLCCTATLAWGVNLPAHAVVIKGTQVYDASKGSFVDLSVLDVLQVFGRAGRPGLETSGEGYICTTEDKLQHYLDAVMAQNPIESQFNKGMIDSLNAEISLGTVANISDAVRWVGYTYLHVRMRKNPFVYGIPYDEVVDDPQLGSRRQQLVTNAAQALMNAGMINFDRQSNSLTVTDLGRIAAKYYIRHQSIEIFNREFRPKMSEADVLAMLSSSTEFDQIQLRENEVEELKALEEIIPCAAKGGTESSQGKVNILLQGYISRYMVDDFALVSDSAYVAQNGGRIIRALLEIAISRKWANVTAVLMGMSKAIEKRLWPFDQPLKQFELKQDVFYNLERWADDWAPSELAIQTAEELGTLIHLNEKHGKALLDAAQQFPALQVDYALRPLGQDVLKIVLSVKKAFNWSSKVHGSSEPFWIWIEDEQSVDILQMAHINIKQNLEKLELDFHIYIPQGKPPTSITIRYVSDRWMGAENEIVVPFDSLVMPQHPDCHTPTLDLPFLSLSAIRSSLIESLYANKFNTFTGLQTQAFWTLINTKMHSLFCAPAASGKSTMAQLLIWATATKNKGDAHILVIVPRRSAAHEYTSSLREFSRVAGVSIQHMSPISSFQRPKGRTVRVLTSSELLQHLERRDSSGPLLGIDLVVLEQLEQMDAAYELSVALLRHATQSSPTRYLGLSHSLMDCTDVAAWLDIDPFAVSSFTPADRNQALNMNTQTFTIAFSASLFKAMAKPTHDAIQAAGPQESAIVFVPSRGQCRNIALDLITQCALSNETDHGYLPADVSVDQLEVPLARLQDRSLVDMISGGIGVFHEGLTKSDRVLMLELFAEGVVRVLLVPHESSWSLPVRASVVVVMGTQYAQYSADSERQIREYDMTEIVHMQSRALSQTRVGHFHLLCQAEAKDTIMRFLNGGLALESELLAAPAIRQWIARSRARGLDVTKQTLLDVLSFTFLARRVVSNPVYYDCQPGNRSDVLSRLVDRIEEGTAPPVAQGSATTS